jgi:hypothetical protein
MALNSKSVRPWRSSCACATSLRARVGSRTLDTGCASKHRQQKRKAQKCTCMHLMPGSKNREELEMKACSTERDRPLRKERSEILSLTSEQGCQGLKGLGEMHPGPSRRVESFACRAGSRTSALSCLVGGVHQKAPVIGWHSWSDGHRRTLLEVSKKGGPIQQG